jgi:hypothetical protein
MILGQFTVSLNGTPLTAIPDPRGQPDADGAPRYQGAYASQDSALQLTRRDVSVHLNRFSRGFGFVRRRDHADDDGYAYAVNGMAWGEQGFVPSGRRHRIYGVGVGGVTGVGARDFNINQIVTFDGHVLALTAGNALIKIPNGDPAVAATIEPPVGAFTAGGGFDTGYAGQSMELFRDASGNQVLIVATTNAATGATRLYQRAIGGAWTASADLTAPVVGSTSLASVWWRARDGSGAQRLVAGANQELRHCIAGSNPLLNASWVTPIAVGTAGDGVIRRLVAAPQRVFAVKDGGIFDVNELRAPNLTPYWTDQQAFTSPSAGIIYDDHIYAGRQFGVDRVPIGGAEIQQQRVAGECGAGFAMQDGTPIRGVTTALTTNNGWLVAALYNPERGETYIGRGKDRVTLGIDCPNPMVWHFAEQVILPSEESADWIYCNAMLVSGVQTAGHPFSFTTYLWLGLSYQISGTRYIALDYIPLPAAGGPLSLMTSGGSYEAVPSATLICTAQNWDDDQANKSVRRYDILGSRLSATRTVELFSRPDGDPTTVTDSSTWTSQGVATSDATSITPTTAALGRSIGLKAVLTTPSPYTSPPILNALSPRAAVRREVFDVRYVWIILERDYPLLDGQPDIRDPDATFDSVTALQTQGAVAYVDELSRTYSVLVEQGIQYDRVQVAEFDWRTTVRLELSILSGPS